MLQRTAGKRIVSNRRTNATGLLPGLELWQEVMDSDHNQALLQYICRSVLSPLFHNMSIDASFYPYIGLTHTIRRKGSAWVVRISDHCRRAPGHVLEAIVAILACKIMRKKPGRKHRDAYELFRKSPSVLESVRKRRVQKGKKRIAIHAGEYHSLQNIFQEINRRYFNNQIEISRIGWGFRMSWGRLGHYDPVHRSITLSPVLDSPRVPEFVVNYIVYHEMLHAVFEDTSAHRSQRHHPPEFRRVEKAYPDYGKAKKFLMEYCRHRKR
jgi:hypothetical protein